MESWQALIPALTDADRARVVDGLPEARARMSEVLQGVQLYWADTAAKIPGWSLVLSWPPAELRRAALALHTMLNGPAGQATLRSLGGLGLPWTREDLLWCLEHAARVFASIDDTAHLELPAAIAARLGPQALTGLGELFEAILDYLREDYGVQADNRRWLTGLFGQALDIATGATIPTQLLHSGDSFGPRARAALSIGEDDVALLMHCCTLDKPMPPTKWRKALRELESGRDTTAAILRLYATYQGYLHDDNDRLIRGLVWAVADDDNAQTTELLADVLRAAGAASPKSMGYPYAPKAAIAAVAALSTRDGDTPVTTFARMTLTVRNKALLSRLHGALEQAGALRGWSLGEAMELAVNDHGLDADGLRQIEVDDFIATITLTPDAAKLGASKDGKMLKTIPDAVKPLRETVKEIGKTLAQERQRVEGLLADEREWTADDWEARYLQHPVTGQFGRRLIWTSMPDGQSGLPHRDGDRWMLVGVDDETVVPQRVRLWHPARADVAQVQAWRDRVMSTGLRQPFKQAFREVYLLTPAEEQTAAYSNRFAGHILRYRQANALMRVRGWQAGYLGTWDGGHTGEAVKTFAGWRASFFHDLVENNDRGDWQARYCSTDQVRFARRDGALWESVPVTDVPPLVFSEAMRDVDLFVGVTSIAADPQWIDRGEDRFRAYWHQTSFGDLTASAEVRRDALARLLPRMKIASRVELTDRFLRVQGKLRTYRIHMGSGNILMEPNDAYLCIVAARDKTGSLHLPIDEDPMLSLILSKAFLLAEDHKITDPTILHQIKAT